MYLIKELTRIKEIASASNKQDPNHKLGRIYEIANSALIEASYADWVREESQLVHSWLYDIHEGLLKVRLHNDKDFNEYHYYDVPMPAVENFMSADSKGQYFVQNIKDNYRFNRIEN